MSLGVLATLAEESPVADLFTFMLWREAGSDTFTGSAIVLSLELTGFFLGMTCDCSFSHALRRL
jgi:hypothetical protein